MVSLDSAKASYQPASNPQPVSKQQAVRHVVALASKKAAKTAPKKAPQPVNKLGEYLSKQLEVKAKENAVASEKNRRLQLASLEAQQNRIEERTQKVTKEILEEAAKKLQNIAQYITENTHLIARDYRVHQATNRITVKIYDSVTGEVIREVPGQDFLDRVTKMEQLIGVMFDNLG